MEEKIFLRSIIPDEARELIEALDRYQQSLYPPENNHLDSVEALASVHVHMIGAFHGVRLVGMGAVKIFDDYGEIKRLYVDPAYRGRGLAKQMMDRLEGYLIDVGIATSRLETGKRQLEALGLYVELGYTTSGPFGTYRENDDSLFFTKDLSGS